MMEVAQEAPPSSLPARKGYYIDDDGLHWKLVGWLQDGRQGFRYLVEFTRPDVPNRSTHSLVHSTYVPNILISTYEHTEESNLKWSAKQNGPRIRLEKILRILDIAWCSNARPDCTAEQLYQTLDNFLVFGKPHKRYDHFFLRLHWTDDAGGVHISWEFAEVLVELMDAYRCDEYFYQWACDTEARHTLLLSRRADKSVTEALASYGWQSREIDSSFYLGSA